MSFETKSRIYRLIAPYQLQIKTEDLDSGPLASTEIIARTLRTAISPGTELAAYMGAAPLRPTSAPYPRVQGYCNVAQVTGAGDAVTKASIGDIILTHSCHRSHFRANENTILSRLEPNDQLDAMSCTYLFHLGYNAALKTVLQAGHRVAVVGVGTLGLTAAAVAKLCGAQTVVGFSNHTPAASLSASFGLDAIHNKKVGERSAEFDIVVVTAGSWDDWKLALSLACEGGKIALLGFPGRTEENPGFNPLASEYVYDKQLSIISCGKSYGGDVPQSIDRFTLQQNCRYLSDMIRGNRLPAQDLIEDVVSSEYLEDCYQRLITHRGTPKTMVLKWSEYVRS